MFNKKSSKQANQDDERAKVPNFGDQKIDEARGKSPLEPKSHPCFCAGKLEQIRRTTNLTISRIKTETDETENKRR